MDTVNGIEDVNCCGGSSCSDSDESMSLVVSGFSGDLSYERRSLVLVGDEFSDGFVIGSTCNLVDTTGVSSVSISCSIESTLGNGEFLILRRLPSSFMWLILMGKRSVGGDIVIAVALRF